jgi:hypothetical protein
MKKHTYFFERNRNSATKEEKKVLCSAHYNLRYENSKSIHELGIYSGWYADAANDVFLVIAKERKRAGLFSSYLRISLHFVDMNNDLCINLDEYIFDRLGESFRTGYGLFDNQKEWCKFHLERVLSQFKKGGDK